MTFRRFSVISISLLILPFTLYKLVQACADGADPYDYYPSFFQPVALKEPAFMPFHYTSQIKYYDDWYDYSADEVIPDANIEAWKSYTHNAVPNPDLDSFVYGYPHAALSNLYYHIEKGKPLQLSSEQAANGFTKWLLQQKDLEALGYLMYAKQVESRLQPSNAWEAPPLDTAKVSRLIRSGLQLHSAGKTEFIRERYAYQILRLSHALERPKQTLDLHQQLAGDKQATTEIGYRILGYKAGALFRLKRKTEAAYLYSKVFDASDNLKRSSYLSFDWSVTDIKSVLALAKTPHEKAVIYLMDGLHEFEEGLPQLESAYTLDPKLKGLDVLMLREINKVEERYLQDVLLTERRLSSTGWSAHYIGEYAYYQNENNAKAQKTEPYLNQLNAFAQKVVADGRNEHPVFWQLASAYLAFISGDLPATKNRLAAVRLSNANPREKDLHEIIATLYTIRTAKSIDAATEASILPKLQWLDSRATQDRHLAKTYRDLMSTVLTTAYLKNHDTVKAVYSLSRVNRMEDGSFSVYDDFTDYPGSLLEQSSPDQLHSIAAFAAKRNKSPIEVWLTQGTAYTADVIKELEGTKYLRMYQFAKAAEVLGQSSRNVIDKHILPNPFIANISDLMEPAREDSSQLYTKLEFAKRMASLQTKDDPISLFEYGCGLYSMSYYGKAHHAYDYYRSSTDAYGYFSTPERRALPPARQAYYNLGTAEEVFIKAAEKTTDAELKAKSLWMAAKCWQKRAPLAKPDSYFGDEEARVYYRYSLGNPYFSQLRSSFNHTAFQKQAYSTCDYYRDYVKRIK